MQYSHPELGTTRRLPPYGRRLAAHLAAPTTWPLLSGTSPNGKHLTLWCACGPDAWAWARPHADTLLLTLLPPGEDPAGYDWRVLAGHPPVLMVPCGRIEAGELDALAAALLRDGAERVYVLGTALLYKRATPCAA